MFYSGEGFASDCMGSRKGEKIYYVRFLFIPVHYNDFTPTTYFVYRILEHRHIKIRLKQSVSGEGGWGDDSIGALGRSAKN